MKKYFVSAPNAAFPGGYQVWEYTRESTALMEPNDNRVYAYGLDREYAQVLADALNGQHGWRVRTIEDMGWLEADSPNHPHLDDASIIY